MSQPQSLRKGREYYLYALMLEYGGRDHLAVAWTRPSSTAREVIGGRHIRLPPGAPPPERSVWHLDVHVLASLLGNHLRRSARDLVIDEARKWPDNAAAPLHAYVPDYAAQYTVFIDVGAGGDDKALVPLGRIKAVEVEDEPQAWALTTLHGPLVLRSGLHPPGDDPTALRLTFVFDVLGKPDLRDALVATNADPSKSRLYLQVKRDDQASRLIQIVPTEVTSDD